VWLSVNTGFTANLSACICISSMSTEFLYFMQYSVLYCNLCLPYFLSYFYYPVGSGGCWKPALYFWVSLYHPTQAPCGVDMHSEHLLTKAAMDFLESASGGLCAGILGPCTQLGESPSSVHCRSVGLWGCE
jgi:hypothetical protein